MGFSATTGGGSPHVDPRERKKYEEDIFLPTVEFPTRLHKLKFDISKICCFPVLISVITIIFWVVF